MGQQRWWEQEIPVDWTINKGELITHNLTELIKPESYEVRLTPITRFGEGDSTVRIVTYSGKDSFSICKDHRKIAFDELQIGFPVMLFSDSSKVHPGMRRYRVHHAGDATDYV